MTNGPDRGKEVLDFWLGDVPPEKRFARDPELDRIIRERFGVLRDDVLMRRAADWRDTPERMLAAIVLLDQFSRNLHREGPAAYAADPLALELTREVMARGWEDRYTAEQRQFLYLPLMHAEDAETQALSVAKFEALGDEAAAGFARDHRDVIQRYGRFPSRNAALSRESTPEEEAYLSDPDVGW